MRTGRRRPQTAQQPWQKRYWAITAYLNLYIHHDEFRRALLELYEGHCVAQEPLLAGSGGLSDLHSPAQPGGSVADWARSYLAAVKDTAERFGLDRLDMPKAGPGDRSASSRGEELLHLWCQLRAHLSQTAGLPCPPEMFTEGVGRGGLWPDVGEVTGTGAIAVGESTVLVAVREPVVRVQIEDRWDPRAEPMALARARLSAEARQIGAELERIAADAEARGYAFADTTPKARQHLRWLFEHVALKKSCGRIAQEQLGGWDRGPSVYNRIKPYADLLGIPLGGD